MKTIAEHLAAFSDDLNFRNYSARTVSDYGYSLRALERFLEQRHITDFTAVTVRELEAFSRWLYHLPTRHGSARGVRHQNTVLAAVRSFFRFLRREGVIIRDPSVELEYAKEPRRLPRNVLTPAEAKRIVEAPDTGTVLGCRDRAVLEVLYATGLRSAELRALRLSDIDLEENLLRIHNGKGGHDRVVPLGNVAARHLQTYLNAIRPQLMRRGATEILFLSGRGGALGAAALRQIARRYARKAKVKKHLTCHLWRHTCATHLIQNRANVRHVQEMLGHRSLSTTERYLWLTITDLKAAHNRFHPRERSSEK